MAKLTMMYTIACPSERFKLSERCQCPTGTPGSWMVESGGGMRCFDPPTQLQKDIWIGTNRARGIPEKDILAALRWACGGCGTVQMP